MAVDYFTGKALEYEDIDLESGEGEDDFDDDDDEEEDEEDDDDNDVEVCSLSWRCFRPIALLTFTTLVPGHSHS